MTHPRATAISVLFALVALVATGTTAARAQSSLTFVSSSLSSSDANNCTSPAAACATFVGAQSKTNDGGAITCAESGFYGSVTVTKSITIDCLAGGGAANTTSVTINAPGKTVRLRNLVVNGVGIFFPGLDVVAAASVHLENVFVTGSNGLGIHDHRAGPAKLVISNSSIEANASAGIVIAPASGSISAVLDNVRSNNNAYGLAVGIGGIMIKRSVFSLNGVTGIHGDGGAVIGVNDTLVSYNATGIFSNGGIALSNSDIDSNNTGISGTTRSHGNNRLFANVSDGTAPTAFGAASSEFGQR